MEKEDIKFETIHKGISFKKLFVIVIVAVLVGAILGKRASHAAYKSSISVPLANGKITYKHPNFKLLAVHINDGSGNYVESDKLPGSDYAINESKTYCTKGGSTDKDTGAKIFTNDLGQHVIENLLKNDRCYLYFDERPLDVSGILAKYTKNTSRTGSITAPFTESTPTTVYSKADDDGISYAFAGVNPNNWVKLGNLYFRIIRFNGDGTMRLIFSGDGVAETSGTGTQIGTGKFNNNHNDNMYVGLQYTSGNVHGTGANSTILSTSTSTDTTTLYGWYNSKIKANYSSIIDINAGFCSDREPYTDTNGTTVGGGTATTETYYGGYIRYVKGGSWQTTYIPTLRCKNASDNLKLPVGLITADEYMLAGGGSGSSSSYYNTTFWLHTGRNYWTVTPCSYGGSKDYAVVFHVNSSGCLSNVYRVDSSLGWNGMYGDIGVRPVINLKTNTTFENNNADGTSAKPYVVKVS